MNTNHKILLLICIFLIGSLVIYIAVIKSDPSTSSDISNQVSTSALKVDQLTPLDVSDQFGIDVCIDKRKGRHSLFSNEEGDVSIEVNEKPGKLF